MPSTGGGDSALDARLSDELDRYDAAATPGVAPAEELTVRVDVGGELLAGASGWTWGEAAGTAMTWVHDEHRGAGLGGEILRWDSVPGPGHDDVHLRKDL